LTNLSPSVGDPLFWDTLQK